MPQPLSHRTGEANAPRPKRGATFDSCRLFGHSGRPGAKISRSDSRVNRLVVTCQRLRASRRKETATPTPDEGRINDERQNNRRTTYREHGR
ncbi:hypothetical protein MRX96_044211 [Rhipicephalus microplus]